MSSGLKLNAKGIIGFAVADNAATDLEGELGKLGGAKKDAVQNRYFVLKGNLLVYFKTETEYTTKKDPTGVILLEDYIVTPISEGDNSNGEYGFRLTSKHHSGQKEFTLQAASNGEQVAWIAALERASFAYLKAEISYLKAACSAAGCNPEPYTFDKYCAQQSPLRNPNNINESTSTTTREPPVEDAQTAPRQSGLGVRHLSSVFLDKDKNSKLDSPKTSRPGSIVGRDSPRTSRPVGSDATTEHVPKIVPPVVAEKKVPPPVAPKKAPVDTPSQQPPQEAEPVDQKMKQQEAQDKEPPLSMDDDNKQQSDDFVDEPKPAVSLNQADNVEMRDVRRPSMGTSDLRKARMRNSKLLFGAQEESQLSTPVRSESGSKRTFKEPVQHKCFVCEKTVYDMEKLAADGKFFHKGCFKCSECKKVIGLGGYAALEGKIYCKPHFKQLFKLKGNYSEGFGKEQHKMKWINSNNPDVESNT